MLQQMGNALGVAGGAIMLRAAALTHPGDAQVTTADFHFAFWAIGLVGLAGVWDAVQGLREAHKMNPAAHRARYGF
jgi:hypothetical protein